MQSSLEIEHELKTFVGREFLEGDDANLDAGTPLISLGVLDSLNMVSLLAHLEGRYGVLVASDLVTPANFESIRSIAALTRTLAVTRPEAVPGQREGGAAQILEQAYNLLVRDGIERGRFSTAKGESVHYLAVEGRSPTWVCLPGMGTPSSSWGPLLQMIAGDHRALAPDYLGFGLSGDDTARPTHRDQVAAMVELILARVDGPIILVGNSAGAMIAAEVARRCAAHVEALVMVGFGLLDDPRAWWDRLQALSKSPGEFLRAAYFRPPRLTNNLELALRQILDRPAYHSFLDDDGVAALRSSFDGLRMPLLFVAGDRDGFFPPATVEAAACAVPDGHYELLARCGHFPPLEQPNELLFVIEQFLSRVRARAGES